MPRRGGGTDVGGGGGGKPTEVKINDAPITVDAEQVLPNYVLVPVLNIAGLGVGCRGVSYQATSNTPISQEYTHQVLNSAYNLQELARVVNDFGSFNGLGDFLGV